MQNFVDTEVLLLVVNLQIQVDEGGIKSQEERRNASGVLPITNEVEDADDEPMPPNNTGTSEKGTVGARNGTPYRDQPTDDCGDSPEPLSRNDAKHGRIQWRGSEHVPERTDYPYPPNYCIDAQQDDC